MNPELMTDKLQDILMKALSICKENSNPELSSEHMMAAFLNEADIVELLGSFKTDVNRLISVNDRYLEKLPKSDSVENPTVSRYLANAYNEALKNQSSAKTNIFQCSTCSSRHCSIPRQSAKNSENTADFPAMT